MVQDIVDILNSRLDSEGVDYYDFDLNFKPCLNSAQLWIVSIINKIRHSNKVSDEWFRDLSYCRVFLTSSASRITLPADLWSIDSVNPLPETTGDFTPSGDTDSEETDLVHIDSNYYCDRLTKEEWELNRGNPFKGGNEVSKCIDSELLVEGSDLPVQFAYMGHYNFVASRLDSEITVRPSIPRKLCTIFYVINPPKVTDIGDTIFFPEQVLSLIIEKTLNFIAYEQGDSTNIWNITQHDIGQLLSVF